MNRSDQACTPCPWLEKAAAFLNEIGIKAIKVDRVEGFLPDCLIVEGVLQYSDKCVVSNLLHEAGHIATVPAQFRSYLSGDVSAGHRRMLEEMMAMELDPDEYLHRACMQCSDPEATAWGWAAAAHLEVPNELRIFDHHFQDEGAGQRLALEMKSHFGINGLSHAGFCVTRPALEKVMGRPAYPKMAFWAQPVIERKAKSACL